MYNEFYAVLRLKDSDSRLREQIDLLKEARKRVEDELRSAEKELCTAAGLQPGDQRFVVIEGKHYVLTRFESRARVKPVELEEVKRDS